MTGENILEYAVDFNKKAFEEGFKNLNSASEQTEKMMEAFFQLAPQIPEDSKSAFRNFCANSSEGIANIKKSVDAALEIDVTQKNAAAQVLNVLESSVQDTSALASKVQEQNQDYVAKLTKDLPKEGQQVIGYMSDAVNKSLDGFKEVINKNFAFAHKVIEESAK
ncbi:MAG: hypothetical protein HQM14_00950 [SAR324 cluster bacterium]|nr:hypothetical protein [SAR324 cluster bacterium]